MSLAFSLTASLFAAFVAGAAVSFFKVLAVGLAVDLVAAFTGVLVAGLAGTFEEVFLEVFVAPVEALVAAGFFVLEAGFGVCFFAGIFFFVLLVSRLVSST